MHLSMHTWMRAEPVESTVARLAKYGYESIELAGEPERNRPALVRPVLESYGITCWGAVTRTGGERSLIAADEALRATSVRYVKDCVTLVKELGGAVVTVVPAASGPAVPDAAPEEEWRWALDGMREIYAHSQAAGVRLAIEPLNRFETYFVNRAEQALALAEATGPDCGVCLDTFHMSIEEADLSQAIRSAGDRLFDVHVAENNRMPAGMGDYDWPRVIALLEEIGYDGALTTAFVPSIDRTPVNPYPHSLETGFADHGGATPTEQFYNWLVEQNADTLLPLIT
jgi:D-psicose/D-tagatose/L-ribulose 3-epimerase